MAAAAMSGGEGQVPAPILTLYNQHTAACGTPPAFSNESGDLYIGYFANRSGEQWIFTRDRATGAATLRGGDVDWATVHVVRDGRVEGLILNAEEAAWLQACWSAASAPR
jgi:hypothetical protein